MRTGNWMRYRMPNTEYRHSVLFQFGYGVTGIFSVLINLFSIWTLAIAGKRERESPCNDARARRIYSKCWHILFRNTAWTKYRLVRYMQIFSNACDEYVDWRGSTHLQSQNRNHTRIVSWVELGPEKTSEGSGRLYPSGDSQNLSNKIWKTQTHSNVIILKFHAMFTTKKFWNRWVFGPKNISERTRQFFIRDPP